MLMYRFFHQWRPGIAKVFPVVLFSCMLLGTMEAWGALLCFGTNDHFAIEMPMQTELPSQLNAFVFPSASALFHIEQSCGYCTDVPLSIYTLVPIAPNIPEPGSRGSGTTAQTNPEGLNPQTRIITGKGTLAFRCLKPSFAPFIILSTVLRN